MKCKDCIAYGYDFTSRLCIARHSIRGNGKNQGCRCHKETIERDLERYLGEKPKGFYTQFRTEWKGAEE